MSDPFPHEDRLLGGTILYVDLVPRSCWFSNARSVLTDKAWNEVKRIVVGRAGGVCEVCGAKPYPQAKKWIEVHERWVFDQATCTQTLGRLIALCSMCHRATHFGLAVAQGREKQALAHLKKINKWTDTQAHDHITQAFSLWSKRNQIPWTLDVRLLTDAGFSVREPVAGAGA